MVAATCVMLALLAGPIAGQGVLVVEGRAGWALPRGAFDRPLPDTELAAGPGTGVHFALRRGSRVYVYLGFSQLRFDCAGAACRGSWISTQWDSGVRVDLRTRGVVPWIRVGVVSPSVEHVPGERGGARGWGGEAGGGVRVPMTERLSLSPGIRFGVADVSRDERDDVSMRFVVADLGLVVAF